MHKENYDKLLQYALRILAKKRYTESEMRQKLTKRIEKLEELGGEDLEAVVRRLQELRYLDDEAFARDYISDKARFNPKGKMLLTRELEKKGVKAEVVEKTLGEIEINESKMALELLERRMKRWANDHILSQKAKAYRFLYSRGFGRDHIYKAIECCYNRDKEGPSV